VLLPAAARSLAPRYGFRRGRAGAAKGGHYVGAIDGLRDWQVYLDELSRLLEQSRRARRPSALRSPPTRRRARGCH